MSIGNEMPAFRDTYRRPILAFTMRKNIPCTVSHSTEIESQTKGIKLHGKNDFVEMSKNLARYRSKNNFIEPSK